MLIHRSVAASDGYFTFTTDAAYRPLVAARDLAWTGENPLWTLLLAPIARVEAAPAVLALAFAIATLVLLDRQLAVPARWRAGALVVAALVLAPTPQAVSPEALQALLALAVVAVDRDRPVRGALISVLAGLAGGPALFGAVVRALAAAADRRWTDAAAWAAGLVPLAVVAASPWPSDVVPAWLGLDAAMSAAAAAPLATSLVAAGAVAAVALRGRQEGDRPLLVVAVGVAHLLFGTGTVALAVLGLWGAVPWLARAPVPAALVAIAAAATAWLDAARVPALHAATWASAGQIARFVDAYELPGPVGVRPSALTRYRASRPVVDLDCTAAPVACDGGPPATDGVTVALVTDPDRRPVVTWTGAVPVALVATPDAEEALRTAAADYAWRLPEGTRSTVAVETPVAEVAVPDGPAHGCTAQEVVLELSGARLVSSSGRVHGGAVVTASVDVAADVRLAPGTYAIEAWARATDVGGEPAVLSVRLGGRPVTKLEVPAGPSRLVRAGFRVEEATVAPLQLVFTNDTTQGGDRNVAITSVRVVRTDTDPARRAADLRADLRGASVLLVSIDTLRADRLGAYGYPRDTSPVLDALAASGSRFDNAVAASHWTAPSHASLLTGLPPPEHGVIGFPNPGRLPADVVTLAERFRHAGWRTAAFVDGGFVTSHLGLDQGFDAWNERWTAAGDRFDEAAAWIREQDGPWFVFVHTYQVHDPYDPPAPWDRKFDPDFAGDERRLRAERPQDEWRRAGPTPRELQRIEALYDGEIAYTDASLPPLLDAASGALVVVTSDHGEELWDHGWIGHGRLWGEVVRVPLIVAHPAVERSGEPVVRQVVSGVDVAPGLLDLATGEGDAAFVRALAGGCDADARAFSTSWTNEESVSVLSASGHYVRHGEVESLFRDRSEARDVAGEADLEPWRGAVVSWRAGLRPRDADHAELDEATLEQLRALGYVP